MNPLEILLFGSENLASLRISDMGQILIWVVYVAIILAFAGAFIKIYKEFGLGKIVQAIREGRDPVKDKTVTRAREKDQFEAWLEEEKRTALDSMYKLTEYKRYDLADFRGKRADIFREVLLKYREMSR